MKTNLIFKRQVNIDGSIKVVTKIVPVDIPMINSGEGWTLSGHTDLIELMSDNSVNTSVHADNESEDPFKSALKPKVEEPLDLSTKFESDVKGTAKLVRSKGVIKIVARRGKTTYNQTTPNSVCIEDTTKNAFFNDCRRKFGNATSLFEFKPSDGYTYDYWNDVIDKEYKRQLKRHISLHN